MGKVVRSIEINAPAEKIWSLVDWDRVPEWYESMKKVEPTSATKMQMGSTVHVFNEVAGRKGEFNAVITELVPNQRVAWKTTDGMPGFFVGTLTPTGSGCRVTTEFDYELPYSVVGKLLDKLSVQKAMEKDAEKALEKMKAVAEK